jgi:glutathione S-transferase
MEEALTLYVDSHWISPYAMTAFVALEEKGLSYTVEEIALHRGEQRSYGAATERVPALRHGEYLLSESLAIAEYLAETFPFPARPRLFPANLRERGRCREVMLFLRTDLLPLRAERPTHSIIYEPATAPLSPDAERAVERLLRACERWIDPARTTLFEAWCIADPDLALMLQRLNRSGHPLPDAVRAYAEANWERPSVRAFRERARPAYTPY